MTVEVRFDLPPERAVEFFRSKGLNTSFAWQDMMREEHDAAFTVAKMMDLDLLGDVKSAVDRAISQGTSLADFRAELEPMLVDRGWWGKAKMLDPQTGKRKLVQLGSPRRLEIIYQTNLRTAYAAGHWSQIVDNMDFAPYLLYDAILDDRTRDDHRAWDDTVLPVAHVWWETHYPPNGWRCRCSVIQLTERQAKRLGKNGPDRAPAIKMRPWRNPRTGEIEQVPIGIDPGWNYHPGRSRAPQLTQQLFDKADTAGALGQQILGAAGLKPVWNPTTATGSRHELFFKDNAPQWLLPAISNAGEVAVETRFGVSYYKVGQRRIVLDQAKEGTSRAGATWRHEFGHHIDYSLGGGLAFKSAKADFLAAMKGDAKALTTESGLAGKSEKQLNRLAANTAAVNEITDSIAAAGAGARTKQLRTLAREVSVDLNVLESWLDTHGGYLGTLKRHSIGRDAGIARLLTAWQRKDAQGFLDSLDGLRRFPGGAVDLATLINYEASYKHGSASNLSDLFSAATLKKVEGSGSHTATYYKTAPYRRAAEVFANITDLAGTGPVGQRILQDFVPSLWARYRQMVSE